MREAKKVWRGKSGSGLKQDEHQRHVGLGEGDTPERMWGTSLFQAGLPTPLRAGDLPEQEVTLPASSLTRRVGTTTFGVLLGYRVFWGRELGTHPAWVTHGPFAPGGGQ